VVPHEELARLGETSWQLSSFRRSYAWKDTCLGGAQVLLAAIGDTAMRCTGVLIVGSLACAAAFQLGSISAAAQGDSPQRGLPAQTIVQFLADPDTLLKQYPNGGPQMLARVRGLAASDPATLKPIVDLIPEANSEQANAIGTGLGQVALW
jgi:hypothetical protein